MLEEKKTLTLQGSEGVVVRAAADIYAGYVAAGRVPEGGEQVWIDRSVREALRIADLVERSVQSDEELD